MRNKFKFVKTFPFLICLCFICCSKSNIDYDKDMNSCIWLLHYANFYSEYDNLKKSEFDSLVFYFSKHIKLYSNEKLIYLKFVTKTWINYDLLLLKDNKNIMEKFIQTGEYTIDLSQETKDQIEILNKTPLKNLLEKEFNKMKNMTDLLYEIKKDSILGKRYIENLIKMKEEFKLKIKNDEEKDIYNRTERIYKETYEKIFKEKF